MNDIENYLDQAIPSICQNCNIPGISFAFYTPFFEPILYSHGLRVCSSTASAGEAVTSETSFQLASVSKFVTSCLVLELSHQNQLQIDHSISHEIWDLWEGQLNFSPEDVLITWSHLLSHRAGFLDYGGLRGIASDSNALPELISWQKKPHLIHRNDHVGQYHYSACSYWVIQQLLERLTGIDFPSLLQKNLFTPLVMTSSFATAYPPIDSNVACGHGSIGRLPSCFMSYPACEAVAGIWSSASDLWLLMEQLLRRPAEREFFNHQPGVVLTDLLRSPFPGTYKLGLYLREKNGLQLYVHTGLNPGFSSGIIFNKAISSGVAFLINCEISGLVSQAFLELGNILLSTFVQDDPS